MKKIFLFTFILALTACSGEGESSQKEIISTDGIDHIYAIIHTNKGDIVCDLAYEYAPVTVGNFIALSEGLFKTKYNDVGEPYYDGLTFHRVLANFMIQAGDPTGSGSGGPGYNIIDEFTQLKHDRPGTLSMANTGAPNSGGSQFFITHVPTPWLDGLHSVFGYVVEGQEVVDNIQQGDIINHIEIQREGASAMAFKATESIKRSGR